MEKLIRYEPSEQAALTTIEQELTQAWAQIGIFSEQLDHARRQRDKSIEKRQAFIQQTVAARGYTGEGVPVAGGVVVKVNEPEPAIAPAGANGGLSIEQ